MDAGVTFRTEFLTILPAEAQAMVKYYTQWQHDGCPAVWEKCASKLAGDKGASTCIPKELLPLTKRIDSVIQTKFSSMGAFVKLSTRSAKDSPIALAKAQRQFCEQLRKTKASSGAVSLNSRQYLLANAVKDSLHVRSGSTAMLHHLHSERVFEDLSDALKRHHAAVKSSTDDTSAPPVFEIELVVREYLRISLENEFRAFVWDGA